MLSSDYLVLNVLLKRRRKRPLIVLTRVDYAFTDKFIELALGKFNTVEGVLVSCVFEVSREKVR